MTIQTLKHRYIILQMMRKTDWMEQYLCREETGSKKDWQFDVFRIKERTLVVKLIPIFMEQMTNTAFEDFFECFSKDGDLYLVFRHRKAISMSEKLEKEQCLLRERIVMGKKLLERILLLNMPKLLVFDVLRADLLQVTPALDVYFCYTLQEIDRFESVSDGENFNRLAEVFEILFAREISLEASSDILKFLETLRQKGYRDFSEVYEAYVRLSEGLTEHLAELKPNTFWFRLWEKIKRFLKRMKPVFFVMILLALAGYLLYSILFPSPNKTEAYNFHQIGDLTVQDTTSAS